MIQPILTSPYVPLWCKSNYSFLEGASHPEELVEEAAHLGIRSIAITDRDGVYGVVRAHVKARECGVRLLIGSEITAEDDSTIVLVAMNATGYANLCELISDGRLRSEKGESKVSWREICERAEGLIALWGRRPKSHHPRDGSAFRRQRSPRRFRRPVVRFDRPPPPRRRSPAGTPRAS